MKEILVALAGSLLVLMSKGQIDPNMTIGEFVSLYSEETVVESSEPKVVIYSSADAALIARVMHAEAKGLSNNEKKAVAWCILNRVDAWGRSIQSVATEPGAFAISSHYTDEELTLALEVLDNWALDGARELPPGYLYFNGNGDENLFRKDFSSTERFSVNRG